MDLNCLKDFPLPKRQYLKKPHLFFKHLFINLRDFKDRGVKGYAGRDVIEFCDWWPRITAAALRDLAEHSNGYPDGKFNSFEEWTDWLHSCADVLESTLEDNWDGQNEYEADWHRIVWEEHNKNPNITMTTIYTDEDKETIRSLYWDREVELEQQRQKLQKETLCEIADKLPLIWD